MALTSPADVVGYGGAAGGGKTDLLLGAALTTHHKAIIFRREMTQLRDIIDRSKVMIPLGSGRLNENLSIWRNLPGGGALEFGGVKDESAVRKYQGRAHDLKGFDELTEFTESQFRYLGGWNRSAKTGQRCRIIATFNPPTSAQGAWVIGFFSPWIDPDYPGQRAAPGELRYFKRDQDGKEVEVPAGTPGAKSRTFIPARLEDNPYLMSAGYADTLDSLPEPLRSQMRYGDFAAGLKGDPWQVIPVAWIRAAQARWTPQRPDEPLSALGVDPARGGDDDFTIARRYGLWYAPLIVEPGRNVTTGPQGAALVHRTLGDDRAAVFVDVIGIGSSVYDSLLGGNLAVIPVNVSEGTTRRDRSGKFAFVNLRSALWWQFREALDPDRGDPIALPPDRLLVEELSAPRYEVRTGRIVVEDKPGMKKRLGRSTDRADAVIMAYGRAISLVVGDDDGY